MLLTDSLGNLLFVKEFGGNGIIIGYWIAPALVGGNYVAGRSTNGDEDFYMLDIDEAGLASIPESGYYSEDECVVLSIPIRGLFSVETNFLVKSGNLFDVAGQLIFHQECGDNNFKTFDISSLSDGFYFLNTQGEDGQKTVKVHKMN